MWFLFRTMVPGRHKKRPGQLSGPQNRRESSVNIDDVMPDWRYCSWSHPGLNQRLQLSQEFISRCGPMVNVQRASMTIQDERSRHRQHVPQFCLVGMFIGIDFDNLHPITETFLENLQGRPLERLADFAGRSGEKYDAGNPDLIESNTWAPCRAFARTAILNSRPAAKKQTIMAAA
jgi:hypothetical protein